ncbi:MAG: alcohol dehydrogenase catalytic domain-containing protein [Candidatus Aenigmarchaeota archaeon]|nr:alcohol dehydrogenase catalytic domain-containing protein [Candidatus Aenigmarchaeota archaeon]
MRVAMYYNNSDVRLEEMVRPTAGPNEVLVRIMASGICGSDVMEWYRTRKAPLVLGHEISGVIEEAGQEVNGFRKGQRVVATHHVPCGSCRYCLSGNETVCDALRKTNYYPGGFSEYVRIPRVNVEKGVLSLPQEIGYEEGTFVEPLGCVVRGQRKAGVKEGQTVLVIGSGLSGLLHIQLAKSKGCTVIATDISQFRLGMAERLGADHVISGTDDVTEKVKEFNGGRLADSVILCASAMPAARQALQSVDRAGTVLVFALFDPGQEEAQPPIFEALSRGATITTSYAAVKKDLAEALDLLRKGRINARDMITHKLPLSETGEGFRLTAGSGDSMKVIIEPWR